MNKEINLKKKIQRNLLLNKRLILKESIKLNHNELYKKFCELIWFKKSKIVASFLSIKSEIPTENLNKFIQKSNKILCLPVINNQNNEALIFKRYFEGESLVEGKYGTRDPFNQSCFLPDIIFTPCLAFDKYGFRLGYGGGYYDKTISYLKSINHNFLTIGFAFDDQKVDHVIHDELDQKLNYILTEKQLYKIL